MKIRLWGTLLADVVIQMLGTDYARILRAIYAFAQVYKHGKLDVLIPVFFIVARMVLTFFFKIIGFLFYFRLHKGVFLAKFGQLSTTRVHVLSML